jgi:hypothetical protein
MTWFWVYYFTPWVDSSPYTLAGSKLGGAGDGRGRS